MGIYSLLKRIGIPPSIWQVGAGEYHGLSMRCAPGTHAAAMELIRSHCSPAAAVLELAAGSGAMLARLRDNQFTDLHAVELDRAKFGVDGIIPQSLDLNHDFAKKLDRQFGLIVAIEIIEHLDSPRHFLREIRELLKENGTLLLSTPNVADWLGRIKFLMTGTLRYFDEDQYRWNHHVSPLPDVQLRLMCREIGLDVVEHRRAGTFFGPLKRIAMAPAWLPFRIAFGEQVFGDVNLYLLKRVSPRTSIAEDWTAQTSL